jgi:hypothetical protein
VTRTGRAHIKSEQPPSLPGSALLQVLPQLVHQDSSEDLLSSEGCLGDSGRPRAVDTACPPRCCSIIISARSAAASAVLRRRLCNHENGYDEVGWDNS